MRKQIEYEKWMPCPKLETPYPGLDYLFPIADLIVARKLDALHEVLGKKGVKYTIYNNDGQKIFLAVQKRTSCRKFNLKLFNYYGNEVIEIKKPFTLCSNKVLVWAPPGNFVGYVEQLRKCNIFIVKNKCNDTVLKIKTHDCLKSVYDVLYNEELIGQIKKQWTVKAVMNYQNFGVSFPTQMDVGDKAVLLGACFLIGYLKY